MALVEYKKEAKIVTFTLNRPEALNSLSIPLWQEFHDRLVDFRDDPELWVGIITGAGDRAFCAGADIKTTLPFMREHRQAPWAIPSTHMRGLDMWKPLIAAINGLAFGGGLEIVLACDIRIASEKARFGQAEVTLGLIPGGGGTQRLPRMIPWCKAAEIILTGRSIDAKEAHRIGLVNEVVPPGQVMTIAKEWAEAICQLGPLAVRAAKEAMIRGSDMTLDDGLRLENALFAYAAGTEDSNEGITAFVEKRRPVYRGK